MDQVIRLYIHKDRKREMQTPKMIWNNSMSSKCDTGVAESIFKSYVASKKKDLQWFDLGQEVSVHYTEHRLKNQISIKVPTDLISMYSYWCSDDELKSTMRFTHAKELHRWLNLALLRADVDYETIQIFMGDRDTYRYSAVSWHKWQSLYV